MSIEGNPNKGYADSVWAGMTEGIKKAPSMDHAGVPPQVDPFLYSASDRAAQWMRSDAARSGLHAGNFWQVAINSLACLGAVAVLVKIAPYVRRGKRSA